MRGSTVSIRSNTTSHRNSTCRTRARALVVVFIALTGAASTLAAQGGRRGGGGDQSAPPRPTLAPLLWEPEQIFPLALAHSNDLKLTDEQRAQIETIGAKLRASNAPLLISIDTLRPPRMQLPQPGESNVQTPTPPPPTPEEVAAVVARRHALGEARAQVHENIRLARDQMTQVMNPDQQARLASLEASARTNAERGDPGGTAVDHSLSGGRSNGQRRGQNSGPPSY
jgi:Spy/CpxP family protein refolding chaperone